METKTFKVPNIGCQGCVNTIKGEVSALQGVAVIDGDKDTQIVTVSYDSPTTWENIRAKLVEIDYAPAE